MLDPEQLAEVVSGMLASAEVGTVVSVLANGAIVAEAPHAVVPAWERREPALATFVATSHPPSRFHVLQRIRHGLAKRA